MSNEKRLSFSISALLFMAILFIIFTCLFIFKAEPHIPLLICVGFLAAVGAVKGHSWKDLESGIVSGIRNGVQPIIILCLIGILIGVWEYSGAIPTVTVYALNLIEPQHLLLTALFSCLVISSLVGSSFTTVSTIGVALIGVAAAAGVPLTWAAGAVICGACFGDKMSPMSDTTNFAAGVGEPSDFQAYQTYGGNDDPRSFDHDFAFLFHGPFFNGGTGFNRKHSSDHKRNRRHGQHQRLHASVASACDCTCCQTDARHSVACSRDRFRRNFCRADSA